MSSISGMGSTSPYSALLQSVQTSSVSIASSLSLDAASIGNSVSGMAIPVDLILLSSQSSSPSAAGAAVDPSSAAETDPQISAQAAALRDLLNKTYS